MDKLVALVESELQSIGKPCIAYPYRRFEVFNPIDTVSRRLEAIRETCSNGHVYTRGYR